jgi:hypothetical protein
MRKRKGNKESQGETRRNKKRVGEERRGRGEG